MSYQNFNNEENKFENRSERRKNMKGRKIRKTAAVVLGCTFLAGSFWGGTLIGQSSVNTVNAAQDITLAKNSLSGIGSTTTALPDVSALVDQCMPQVVSITNVIEVTSTNNDNGFYNYFFNQGQSGQQSSTQTTNAYGSGVIIGKTDDELLIVTNNHVAVYDKSGNTFYSSYTASTKELKVTFADGVEASANLKGADSDADIAVIAVPLSSLSNDTLNAISVATIGDSDELKVGQGVLAIGNALGRGQTATVGYISALNREVTTSEDGITRTLLQTDAAINAGNSGGGLFNANGELIGINSSKYSDVGVEGMGYSIPISSVEELINNLMNEETKISLSEDERGYLGIKGADVPASYVSAYGLPEGAMVTQITEGSPAAQSGLQVSDIITGVNGQKVTNYEELRNALSYFPAGETVELTVERATGSKYTETSVSVTLASKEDIVGSTEAETTQAENEDAGAPSETRISLQKATHENDEQESQTEAN